MHRVEVLGDDPLGVYLAAAADCGTAWRRPGAMEGNAPSTIGDFPAKAVINARIFDTTVLTWDVATACGVAHGIDDLQAAYVLRVARALVPALRQHNPGRFQQPSDPDDDRPLVEQMIAATGRDSSWRPL